MAAIVIVIISRGIFKRPIIPKIKNAAKKFGTTPINDNLIFLNKIQNIINIPIITNPRVNIELGNSKDYLLFNLDEDISQQNDLSKSNPEKLNEMIARYDEILGNNKKKAEKLELE